METVTLLQSVLATTTNFLKLSDAVQRCRDVMRDTGYRVNCERMS